MNRHDLESAADEITRLRARVEEMEGLLRAMRKAARARGDDETYEALLRHGATAPDTRPETRAEPVEALRDAASEFEYMVEELESVDISDDEAIYLHAFAHEDAEIPLPVSSFPAKALRDLVEAYRALTDQEKDDG